MFPFRSWIFALATLLAGPAAAADSISVVASIKPVHSLVSAVMAGVGTPHLIVRGGGSPHTYSLKPSDAVALDRAAVVFWVGPDLELFLVGPLAKTASKARVVSLSESPGLTRLAYRVGGPFETHVDHDHEHDHDSDHQGDHDADDDHDDDHGQDSDAEQEHGRIDMHLWLDPLNAKAMAADIAVALAAADPSHAAAYAANARALDARLDGLIRDVAAELEPVRSKPFIVFHDAYQYFERRFGLTAAGSITVSPEVMAGAQRVSEVRRKVRELGATCVFSEPQFEPRLVRVVIEGTAAASGVLDPEGAALADGPDLYFRLLRDLSGSLRRCLGRTG